jgi:hypothetical protein
MEYNKWANLLKELNPPLKRWNIINGLTYLKNQGFPKKGSKTLIGKGDIVSKINNLITK